MPLSTRRITAAISTKIGLDASAGVERDAKGDVIAFRLFRAGDSPTDHGLAVFNARAARLVMAERDARGNRYAIDFDHLSLAPDATPEQRRAAGSFDIAVRNGELWAVNVRFTDEAARFVRDGAYLSVSPAFNVDKKTGEIVSLTNCALTSNPATHGAVRFAASRSGVGASKASTFSISRLRELARCADRETADVARRLLAARGMPVLDPKTEDGQRLQRMTRVSTEQRPLVRHTGRSVIFTTAPKGTKE